MVEKCISPLGASVGEGKGSYPDLTNIKVTSEVAGPLYTIHDSLTERKGDLNYWKLAKSGN